MGQSMKNLMLVCEAKLSLDESESSSNRGSIEARATTWGAREGLDGRRFNYQPEGFAQWADEFSKADKPLPMFLNHFHALTANLSFPTPYLTFKWITVCATGNIP